MPPSDAQKKATAKYKANNLKRIPLDVRKEKYEEIKAAANKADKTVNGYIKEAIDEKIQRDTKSN